MFGVLHPKAMLSNPTNILRTVPYMGRRGQRKPVDLSTRSISQRTRGRGLAVANRRSRGTPRSRYPRTSTGRGQLNPLVVTQNPAMYYQTRGQRSLRTNGCRRRGMGRGAGRGYGLNTRQRGRNRPCITVQPGMVDLTVDPEIEEIAPSSNRVCGDDIRLQREVF